MTYFATVRIKFTLLFVLIGTAVYSQSLYFIGFSEKSDSDFDPYTYFDQKAIERRLETGLPLYDEYDLPVNPEFVDAVATVADSLGYCSRWLNGVFAYGSDPQFEALRDLPFVASIIPLREKVLQPAEISGNLYNDPEYQMDLAKYQVERLGITDLTAASLRGKGVRVAVLDVGFSGADEHIALKHLFSNGNIIKTYNFVGKNEDVYGHGSHGTSVLACIAGQMKGQALGLAPDAEFLLARTERNFFERLGEEQHWIAAAEWADKNGASIINSSLGYTNQRYFMDEMDGQTTLISKGAKIAVEKGILIVNAAGNEGDIWWRVVGSPADVEGVLSVGGTDPYTDAHIEFSSLGPTPDGRLKPNVSAPGMVVSASKNSYQVMQGTSFASPLVAGFAACAKQRFPELTGQELHQLIEETGHLYPYYDYAHGYGIPQASRLLGDTAQPEPTFEMDAKAYKVFVKFSDEFLDISDTSILVHPPKNLYFSVLNEEDFVLEYKVIQTTKPKFSIYYSELFDNPPSGQRVRLHFEGYTETKEIPAP
jgi:subtilisin family serine protease